MKDSAKELMSNQSNENLFKIINLSSQNKEMKACE